MRLPSTWLLLLLISLLLVSACGKTYTPKPKGYPRFDLQKPIYSKLPLDVPYTFNVNNTAKVMLDTSKYAEPFWIDIKYPQFDASVQLTYKHLDKDLGSLNGLVEDCRKLVSKHQVKASSIEEYTLKTANGNTAYCFQLAGQVMLAAICGIKLKLCRYLAC